MRLLIITNLYPPDVIGGYEIGCRQMARSLRERDHDVLVLTSKPVAGEPPSELDGIRVERTLELAPMFVQLHGPATAYTADVDLPGRLLEAHNVDRLVDAIQEFRPDICYLWNLVGIGGLGLVALLEYLGQPWTWHLMDRVPLDVCSVGGSVNPHLASLLSHAEHGSYIACSRRLASEIEAGGVSLQSRVEFVPNWVDDTTAWTSSESRTFWTADGTRPIRLLHAGRLGREKGTDIALEVASALVRHGYAATIDLFGTPVDAAGRPDQTEVVRSHGPVPHAELVELMAQYDLLLFPTWHREPFGFVALEAAAQGCLPLITAGCGSAEWLRDGYHCLQAPRTLQGFLRIAADALSRGDIEMRARAAASAVQQDFALSRLAASVEHVLAEATRSAPARLEDLPRARAIAHGAQDLLIEAWPARLTQWRRRAYLVGRTVQPLVRRLPFGQDLGRRALRMIAGR